MDEHYIRANDIIERYVLDQLSDREQYEFEEYYFEHPEIMEELEVARAMRDGLRSEPIRKLLEACATACRLCGEECERHASKHEHCRVCAESCRQCEKVCQAALKTF